jgi:hypothetical protein
VEEPWFLPPDEPEEGDHGDLLSPLLHAGRASLVNAAGWRAAEAALSADLAELAFDLGRLAERVAVAGTGAVQRLALAEASSLSWWTGDRVGADRLALWLSYRIGAAEEGGEGLIRTAWAARRLAAPKPGSVQRPGLADLIAASLGEEGRADDGLLVDVAVEMAALDGVTAVTRGCALCHLWRALDERPDHLRGLEAAVLGARLAGQGALPFLPAGRLDQRRTPRGTVGAHDAGATGPVAGEGRSRNGRPAGPHAYPADRSINGASDARFGTSRGRNRGQPSCGAAKP